MEVNGEELNIKKLYEKFRTTNSHTLVSSQFLSALNIFFGGDYQNMTVSTLSNDNGFTFDTFTDLSTFVNLSLRRRRNENINSIKVEDDNTDLKLKTKYEFDDDDPLPPYPFDIIQDKLNTEPENIDEKAKQIDIVGPKLETPAELEESDKTRKADKSLLYDFYVP